MTQTESVRQRLLARREELARRAERTAADLRHDRDPIAADFAEQVVQRENEDVLRGIGGSARDELQQVNRALARLERGEYFSCAVCGALIESARLDAVPTADRCIRCARVPD